VITPAMIHQTLGFTDVLVALSTSRTDTKGGPSSSVKETCEPPNTFQALEEQ